MYMNYRQMVEKKANTAPKRIIFYRGEYNHVRFLRTPQSLIVQQMVSLRVSLNRYLTSNCPRFKVSSHLWIMSTYAHKFKYL